MKLREICALAPVMPVLVVEDVAHAAPLAKALRDGGLSALEVTLRTPAALDAIREMSAAAPEAVVGAGTLLTPEDLAAAKSAGARFGVSPGSTPRLLEAAREVGLPLLPGVATATEAMAAAEHGYEVQKFFPAEQSGGARVLQAWAAPLPSIQFCPTGGVSPENAESYLRLSNVLCVGGSWIAPRERVARNDWTGIAELARQAAALKP